MHWRRWLVVWRRRWTRLLRLYRLRSIYLLLLGDWLYCNRSGFFGGIVGICDCCWSEYVDSSSNEDCEFFSGLGAVSAVDLRDRDSDPLIDSRSGVQPAGGDGRCGGAVNGICGRPFGGRVDGIFGGCSYCSACEEVSCCGAVP